MRGLTDFLITVHVMRGLVGRGPVLVGLALITLVPIAVIMALIDGLYQGGIAAFCGKIIRALIAGTH
jgi:hypothetical protein